jgi:hypothetical protein
MKTPAILIAIVLGLSSCTPGQAHYFIKDVSVDTISDTITLLPNQPYSIDDRLTVAVVGIGEIMYAPDKRTEMEISLHMKTPEKEKDISFTSDKPTLVWEGYEFEYLGGWTNEVRLKLKRTPFGPRK